MFQEPNESLGMRIGGGLGSNEGDIPIYIANIHPQGCVGRTQQILVSKCTVSFFVLPPRTCPGCSVPEPYRSHDWALVPAKPGLQG